MARLRRQKQQIVARSQRRTVSSPIAGEVLTLYQKVGAYVTAGTPVALVGDFKTLRFAVPIDKRENKRISLGQEALFSVDGRIVLYGRRDRLRRQTFHAAYRDGRSR